MQHVSGQSQVSLKCCYRNAEVTPEVSSFGLQHLK